MRGFLMFDFFKKKKKETHDDNQLHAIVDGTVINLTDVPDPVFSQKMMGDGFAMKPTSGDVYAPVYGTVRTVFPTKHALGLVMDNGIEILLHLGVDTVELEGKPFTSFVSEGDKVTPDTKLISIDLAQLEKAGKDNSLMVIFTKPDTMSDFSVNELQFKAGDIIGTVSPK